MKGRQSNSISVGGDVSGSVVAGNRNVVQHTPRPQTAEAGEPAEGLTPRLGFVFDIVGYGGRLAEGKADLEERLSSLTRRVVADLGIDLEDTRYAVSGDGIVVFLPVGVASTRVLPTLICAASSRLASDNNRFRDRMRLRLAVGSGLLGDGPLGFTGDLVVDLHRLVDSDVLRQAVRENPKADLAILVSAALHDEVVRPGYLDARDFTRCEVTTKEFSAPAWLRLC
ncbi:hypothetical protein [Actinophytocola xanthii]|uniref:Guanylate cyclase domain-containing protein n=1 Tax=Actinophytocola xanthii TaxID=1912961 RepID=A0A1Q8CS00_9PSEU|nr:hypothetical protein [Actinophytocola xanthii]OLF17152.1 hypothetical protein BU204_12920 [Actinophytocola xanthii]